MPLRPASTALALLAAWLLIRGIAWALDIPSHYWRTRR